MAGVCLNLTRQRSDAFHQKRKNQWAVSYEVLTILAVLLLFAANYQPSASRLRRESWARRGLGERENSEARAVLSLFPDVEWKNTNALAWI
jgi:hypothetical protein